MLITIICVALLLLCFTIGDSDLKILMVVLLAVVNLANLLAIVGFQSDCRADIRRFESTRVTIERQRHDSTISDIERAALITTIVEKNNWLANEQYEADCVWHNWYTLQSVKELQPLH